MSPRTKVAVVALVGLWLVMVVAADPRGNFPLNDDWNYARTVKALIDDHHLIVTCWSLAASITHVVAGWLACLVTGFSFETLRATGLLAGLAAGFAAWVLLRMLGASLAIQVLAAATLMTNPLFFELANTFMTDVPFVCLATFSMVVFSRQLLSDTWPPLIDVLSGSVLSALACLSRQTGLVIPLAFLIAMIASRKASRQSIVRAILPLATAVIAVACFQVWLQNAQGTPFAYVMESEWLRQQFARGPLYMAGQAAGNILSIFVYLGLFSLPVCLSNLTSVASLEKGQRTFFVVLSLEFALLVSACLAFQNAWMPLADNVLFDCGLGPLFTTSRSGPAPWPAAPRALWTAVTLLGAAGGGVLIAYLAIAFLHVLGRWRSKERPARDQVILFLTLTAVLYISLIAVRGYFDRYLIFPLVPLMALAGSFKAGEEAPFKPFAFALSIVLIGLTALFSVAATHDYLSWNRARWQALTYLTDELKVSPMRIDGGLEFNGWSAYDPRFASSAVVFNTQMSHGDDYAVFFRPFDGYVILRSFPFHRWLPPGEGEIVALKKGT